LVIDFTRVRFLTSLTLGLLVDTWRRMKEYNGRLMICGINPQLMRVFRITHLDRIFEFSDDPASAVRAIKNHT
jgi:anti-sigma B factor antagonist